MSNLSKLGNKLKKAAPTLLLVLGIGATCKAVQSASKAGAKSARKLDGKEDLAPKDKVALVWKDYIETGIWLGVAVSSHVAGHIIDQKRIAAASAAAEFAASAYAAYREKAKEVLGDRKEDLVDNRIAKDKVDKTPYKEEEVIETGNGGQLFMDICGRRFHSSVQAVQHSVEVLNCRMNRGDEYASLNDLYYEWGLRSVEIGDLVGWNIMKTGIIECQIDYVTNQDGTPIGVISFSVLPQYKYQDTYGA